MDERQVRGSVLNGYMGFVRKTWGEDGLDSCLQSARLKGHRIDEGKFYPNDCLLDILRWISAKGGMEKVRHAGKFSIKNLGLLSYLVRFMSMEQMLDKAEVGVSDAFRFGKATKRVQGKRALITMRDFSDIEENCQGWMGAFEGLMELARTSGTVRKTKCQLKGDDRCEYALEWR